MSKAIDQLLRDRTSRKLSPYLSVLIELLAIVLLLSSQSQATRTAPDWAFTIGGATSPQDVRVLDFENRVVVFTSRRLCVYRRLESRPGWCATAPVSAVAYLNGTLSYIDRTGKVLGVDPVSGRVRWSTCLFARCDHAAASGLYDGPRIAVAGHGFIAWASDPARPAISPYEEISSNGHVLWSTSLPGAVGPPRIIYERYVVQTVLRIAAQTSFAVIREGQGGGQIVGFSFLADAAFPTTRPNVLFGRHWEQQPVRTTLSNIELAVGDVENGRITKNRVVVFRDTTLSASTNSAQPARLVAVEQGRAYIIAADRLYSLDVGEISKAPHLVADGIVYWLGNGLYVTRTPDHHLALASIITRAFARQNLDGLTDNDRPEQTCGSFLLSRLTDGAAVLNDTGNGREIVRFYRTASSDVICSGSDAFKQDAVDSGVRLMLLP